MNWIQMQNIVGARPLLRSVVCAEQEGLGVYAKRRSAQRQKFLQCFKIKYISCFWLFYLPVSIDFQCPSSTSFKIDTYKYFSAIWLVSFYASLNKYYYFSAACLKYLVVRNHSFWIKRNSVKGAIAGHTQSSYALRWHLCTADSAYL